MFRENISQEPVTEENPNIDLMDEIQDENISPEDFFAIHEEEQRLNEAEQLKKEEKKAKFSGIFGFKKKRKSASKESKINDKLTEKINDKVKLEEKFILPDNKIKDKKDQGLNTHSLRRNNIKEFGLKLINKAKHLSKKQKYIILGVSFFLVLTIVYAFTFGSVKYTGYAEATVYPQVSEVSGKILEYPVNLGQVVEEGDIIAIIDSQQEQFALEQLELSLEKLKIALADSKSGNTTDDNKQNLISLAETKYNSAVDVANLAAKDYNDALELYSAGSLTESDLSSYRLASELAFKEVEIAKAELSSAKTSNTAATLEVEISLVENQIAQLEKTLKKFQIKASCNGTVLNKHSVIGEVISVGNTLVEIATEDEMYLNFRIPKTIAKKISYNQEVNYEYKNTTYKGHVLYIDLKNQFSGEEDSKNNKEYANIKVAINTGITIKPGEKVHLIL